MERILIDREHLFWKNRKSVHDETRIGVHDGPEYALNSYSRQHPLYQALKTFGQITKSLFILGYIDNVRDLDPVRYKLIIINQLVFFTKISS